MIIVVSNKELNLGSSGNILVVESLLDASKVTGSITAVVIYSSSESTTDFAANFATLKSKNIGSLWYISNQENKDDLVEMSVIGSGGYYIEDEFFLESDDLLESLIGGGGSNQLMEIGGVGVLKDFVDRYLQGTSNQIPKGYLQALKSSVTQISEDYKRKSEQLLVLSEKATSVIEDSSLGLQEQEKERQRLAGILKEIQESMEDTKPQVRGSNVAFFPRVSFLKEKDIVRIKDIGRTPYLFSFVYGFLKYADKVLNKRPKLIVVEPVGNNFESHYSEFNWVTSENHSDRSKYFAEVSFTNYPTTQVLTSFIEDSSKDFFIVLDRTTTSPEHILNTRKTRSVHYAVTGNSIIESLKLKSKNPRMRYFSSAKELSGAEFTIPFFDYPESAFERENLYLTRCGEQYQTLTRKG
jgi:hypothetical protein